VRQTHEVQRAVVNIRPAPADHLLALRHASQPNTVDCGNQFGAVSRRLIQPMSALESYKADERL